VGTTISSLYALISIDRIFIEPDQIALALVVGVGSSLLAAWRPAAEAAACDPAIVLRKGSLMDSFCIQSKRWGLFGLCALALASIISYWTLTGGGRLLGFVAVGLLIAGFSLLVPVTVNAFCSVVRGPGWLVRLAGQHLARSLHRNAVTIAALAVAAAMTVSVSVMIHSFRASVTTWLGQTLVADLFISPAANEIAGLTSFIPANAVDWIRHDPRVKEVGTFREMPVPWGEKTATLAVIDGRARGEFDFVRALDGAREQFQKTGMVAVSESFSTKHGTEPGDTLEFSSPKGAARFTVVGVIKDFTRDSGLVMIERTTFSEYWNDERLHSLSITLKDPSATTVLGADFREKFSHEGEFSIYTNADLRQRVLEIFDQTFAVTSVLRTIAVVVAIAGVLLSLTTLVLEREREVGVLRSQGASRAQIQCLVLSEAAMIGLLASLIGVACGASMAMILTWVINKAFFGWTIELRYPLDVLLTTPLWIIPAAVFAAWMPSRRASRIPPARAIRCD